MMDEKEAGNFLRHLGFENFSGEKWLDIAKRVGHLVVPNEMLPPEVREKSLPYKLGRAAANAHHLGGKAAERAITIRDIVFSHDEPPENKV